MITIKSDPIRIPLLVLLSLVVGAAAITTQSFWMDEGGPAFKSLLPTFREWWAMTLQIRGSDVQMPVFMPAVWAWEKIFGHSEFALRAINLPFLAIMVIALRKVPFWPLVCLTSPFVLYYVGELRPYAMQMAAAACGAAALGRIIHNPENNLRGLHTLLASAVFLSAASLSSTVWAAGLVLASLVVRPDWLRNKRFWLHVLAWLPAALLLAAYYGFTLVKGFRAAPSAGGGLLSMLFGFYEMSGLLGLGPARHQIRSSPAILLSHLAWLLPAAACLFTAWCLGLRQWIQSVPKRSAAAAAIAVILPVLILAATGLIADFRVLGRHMSPAMPAVLLPFCACLSGATGHHWHRAAGIMAVIISLVSAAFLRFDPRHARDDYRAATGLALDALARNQAIMWDADIATPCYYAYRKGGWPMVKPILSLRTERPSSHMFADLVVINRPDHSYRNRDHRKILEQAAFKPGAPLHGFEVWENRYSSGN